MSVKITETGAVGGELKASDNVAGSDMKKNFQEFLATKPDLLRDPAIVRLLARIPEDVQVALSGPNPYEILIASKMNGIHGKA